MLNNLFLFLDYSRYFCFGKLVGFLLVIFGDWWVKVLGVGNYECMLTLFSSILLNQLIISDTSLYWCQLAVFLSLFVLSRMDLLICQFRSLQGRFFGFCQVPFTNELRGQYHVIAGDRRSVLLPQKSLIKNLILLQSFHSLVIPL